MCLVSVFYVCNMCVCVWKRFTNVLSGWSIEYGCACIVRFIPNTNMYTGVYAWRWDDQKRMKNRGEKMPTHHQVRLLLRFYGMWKGFGVASKRDSDNESEQTRWYHCIGTLKFSQHFHKLILNYNRLYVSYFIVFNGLHRSHDVCHGMRCHRQPLPSFHAAGVSLHIKWIGLGYVTSTALAMNFYVAYFPYSRSFGNDMQAWHFHLPNNASVCEYIQWNHIS